MSAPIVSRCNSTFCLLPMGTWATDIISCTEMLISSNTDWPGGDHGSGGGAVTVPRVKERRQIAAVNVVPEHARDLCHLNLEPGEATESVCHKLHADFSSLGPVEGGAGGRFGKDYLHISESFKIEK